MPLSYSLKRIKTPLQFLVLRFINAQAPALIIIKAEQTDI